MSLVIVKNFMFRVCVSERGEKGEFYLLNNF